MDSITLTGIRAWGRHGVLGFEKARPQEYVVDATLFLDVSRAGRTDSLADTVDYGQIAQRIVSVVEGPHVDLIEALATRIADAILCSSMIRSVIVTVHKPSAPLTVPFADVSVRIERSRVASDADRAAAPDFVDARDGAARAEAARPSGGIADRRTGAVQRPTHFSDAGGEVEGGMEHGPHPAGEPPEDSAFADATAANRRAPVVHHAVISMGGNLGNVRRAMREAIVAMDGITGNQIMGISPLYRTTPWGMDESAPDFLNAVVQLDTLLDGKRLLHALQLIEAAHGRSHQVHWGSRPLDLDIIDFDGQVSEDPELTLPHPRAWQRAFVLAPWKDLDPQAVLPGEHGGTVADLLQACPDRKAIERVSDTWIMGEADSSGFPDAGPRGDSGDGPIDSPDDCEGKD